VEGAVRVEAAGCELEVTEGSVALGTEGISAAGGCVGTDEGRTGTPGGDCTPGTPGKENNSLADGIEEAMPGWTDLSVTANEGASGLATGTGNVAAWSAGT